VAAPRAEQVYPAVVPIVSADLPPLKLKVADEIGYVGRLQINLYGLADADIFVFAEAGEERKFKRLIIVQFEGYLDTNTYTYNYAMQGNVVLGEHEYMYDDYVAHSADIEQRPDSDGAQVMKLLRENGYERPDDTIRRRYVRLLGEDRRKEILIIYMEDLKPLGYTTSDLTTDGWLPPEHAAVGEALHKRAQEGFTVLEG
jgi:hypothetical protein